MSPLTYWLGIGALAVVTLFAMNALAYRRRFGTLLRAEARPTVRGRILSKTETVLFTLPVLGMLVCLAMPVLAPESAFTRWLLTPYSRVVFIVWCFLIASIANALLAIRTALARSGG